MAWSERVVRHIGCLSEYWDIREVYYNKRGRPNAMGVPIADSGKPSINGEAPCGCSYDEVLKHYVQLGSAFSRPFLTFDHKRERFLEDA